MLMSCLLRYQSFFCKHTIGLLKSHSYFLEKKFSISHKKLIILQNCPTTLVKTRSTVILLFLNGNVLSLKHSRKKIKFLNFTKKLQQMFILNQKDQKKPENVEKG